MKKLLWIVPALASLAGCQPAVPPPKVEPTAPAVADKAPVPDETKPEATAATKPQKAAEASNPKRLYQLADLQKAKIEIDGKSISVWVMNDEGKREEGMMWLDDKDVKNDEGMLFVFPAVQPVQNGFWMQNTVLPLDIMYFSHAGKLINTQEGKPFDETSLKPTSPYLYVVEMKQGSAKRLGFRPGSSLVVPKDATQAQ